MRPRREACAAVPAAALLGTALGSDLNIGIRHLLPVLPLLHVLCGRLARLTLGPAWLRVAGQVEQGTAACYAIPRALDSAGKSHRV